MICDPASYQLDHGSVRTSLVEETKMSLMGILTEAEIKQLVKNSCNADLMPTWFIRASGCTASLITELVNQLLDVEVFTRFKRDVSVFNVIRGFKIFIEH